MTPLSSPSNTPSSAQKTRLPQRQNDDPRNLDSDSDPSGFAAALRRHEEEQITTPLQIGERAGDLKRDQQTRTPPLSSERGLTAAIASDPQQIISTFPDVAAARLAAFGDNKTLTFVFPNANAPLVSVEAQRQGAQGMLLTLTANRKDAHRLALTLDQLRMRLTASGVTPTIVVSYVDPPTGDSGNHQSGERSS